MRRVFNKQNTWFIIFSVLSFFMVTITREGGQRMLSEVGTTAVGNVQYVFGNALLGLRSALGSVTEVVSLRQKNAELEQHLQSYRGYERLMGRLRMENEEFRLLLKQQDDYAYKTTVAKIIAKDPSNFFTYLVLNKGSRDGIESDMAVVAFNASRGMYGLVGRIVSVSERTSILLPIFNETMFVVARLENSRHEGLIEGGVGLQPQQLLFNYVSRSALSSIKLGDLVVTGGVISPDMPSIEYRIPAGIYVGEVEQVIDMVSNTSLQLILKSVVDFSQLEYLFIVHNEANEEPLVVSSANGAE
jgi:rod shape-determining protein MreC